jgi:CDP-diglyceride synthetase
MYEVAEKKINQGLSPTARSLIAVCSIVLGVVMVLVAPPTNKAPWFYVFAGFCFLIALACVTRGRANQIFGSLVGSALFAFTLAYLGYEVFNGPVVSKSRSEPSTVTAVLCFFAFGLPGARYVWKARFGFAQKSPPSNGV